jgi:hypothetical protein
MNKNVLLIIVVMFSLLFSVFGKPSSGKDSPITLLNNLGGFGGKDNLLVISSRVKDGVVSVKAVSLQEIRPQKIFFKGVVSSIANYSVMFDRRGTIDYIIGKGTYVFGTITDENGKVIRKGSVIATLNKKEVAARVEKALKRKKLSDMSYDFMKRMTKAHENLAKKNIITSFALEETQMQLYINLLTFENMTKETDALILTGKDPNIYSVRSGLITDVLASVGDQVTPGTMAVGLMQMDPLLIKIPCPIDILDLQRGKEKVMVYPKGENNPVNAVLELKEGDLENAYVHVPNKVIGFTKLTSRGKGLAKVYSVFPVKNLLNKNLESFYLPNYQGKDNILAIPTVALRHDDKGYYVYRIKDFNAIDKGGETPKYFQVEKVAVSLGGVSTAVNYRLDSSELVRSIVDNGVIKVGDIVVGRAQSNCLKDGEDVVYMRGQWQFYPQQEVRVRIPALSKAGIYVPRKAIIHQDFKDDYVYLVQHGIAKLKKVYVLGFYEDYCLISGKDIVPGERAIIIDDPVLFKLLYDGRKVNVADTEAAPVFMEKEHAIDLEWLSQDKSDMENTGNMKNRSGMQQNFQTGGISMEGIGNRIKHELMMHNISNMF